MSLRRRTERGETARIEERYDGLLVDHDETLAKNSVHNVSSIFAVLIIIVGVLLFDAVVKVHHTTPTQLKITDEKSNPSRFIGERAQNHLKQLASIGPKVTGSYENEVLAVDFLKREINFILQQANREQKIEFDHQKVSGAFYLGFLPYGLVNVYNNVQNLIVRIESAKRSTHTLLINCHFDSVPTSPGASDNGINCVAMLEVIRILSKESIRPLHNIIFLFNGAEENPLQGAHGFIAYHKWAKEVKAVINLDAAGSGGREILFQAGPGNAFLLNAYVKNAPHPYGQSAGEEIFQANLIPSDTDFRVFRDFGHIPGLDLAFMKNGYVYHTKYDNIDQIDEGSYQHIGDNLLALVKTLSASQDLPKASLSSKDKLVYFDFIGFTMISYSDYNAIIINILVIAASMFVFIKFIYDLRQSSLIEVAVNIFFSGTVQVIGIIVALFLTLVIGFFIDYLGANMSWYSRPRVIFGLFMCPCLILLSIFLVVLNNILENVTLSKGTKAQIHCHTNRLIWTFMLTVTTFFAVRVSYIFLIPVFFGTQSFVIIGALNLAHTRRAWLYIYLINSVIPTIFSMYFTTVLLELFIPITGRFGSDKNPDDYIGVLSVIGCTLIASAYIPLITLLRKPLTVVIGLLMIFLITLGLITFTSYGFPYSGKADTPSPQRYWVYHTNRVFHDESGNIRKQDSGIFLLNMDRNSPKAIEKYVPEINNAVSLESDCAAAVYCGLPIYTSRMLSIHQASTWIPTGPPVIHEPVQLKLISKQNISSSITRYSFRTTGPDHYTIFLSPKPRHSVKDWSFVKEIPERTFFWQGRPTYFILYGYGERQEYWDFWIDIEAEHSYTGRPAIDIAISGKYTHHDKLRTEEYNKFLAKFPEWAHTTAWMASYISWVY